MPECVLVGRPTDAPKARSDSDPPGVPRIACVGAHAFLRAEVQIPLDRQAQPSPDGR